VKLSVFGDVLSAKGFILVYLRFAKVSMKHIALLFIVSKGIYLCLVV
jgi:hypothetical protein